MSVYLKLNILTSGGIWKLSFDLKDKLIDTTLASFIRVRTVCELVTEAVAFGAVFALDIVLSFFGFLFFFMPCEGGPSYLGNTLTLQG